MPMRLAFGIVFMCLVSFAFLNHRHALWMAVNLCKLVPGIVGPQSPCFQLNSEPDGRTAYALLRVRPSRTHFILTPLTLVSGVEASELKGTMGADIWRSAWETRKQVSTFANSLSPDFIGVAVNSRNARSQDLLHFHIDCIRPGVLRHMGALRNMARGSWTPARLSTWNTPFYIRHVESVEIDTLNPFRDLDMLPRTMAAASLIGLPSSEGGLLLLALQDSARGAEELLDHKCSIASQKIERTRGSGFAIGEPRPVHFQNVQWW